MKYHIQGRKKGQHSKKDKSDLNVILYDCTRMLVLRVTLPDSVTQIGSAAFSYCTNLTDVIILSSVTEIGGSVFFACNSLRRVVIANGNAEIGDLAFSNYVYPWGYYSMKDVTVYSTANGKVEKYYKKHGISFVALTADWTGKPEELDKLNNLTKLKDLSKASLTLSKERYTYSGKARKPTVTIRVSGAKLVLGTDYKVTYSNNVNVGTAKVTIQGDRKSVV